MQTMQIEVKTPKNFTKIIAIAIISLILTVTFGLAIVVFSYANVYPNVSLCGVSLGKMSREQATNVVAEMFESASAEAKITLIYKDEKFDIDIPNKFSADVNSTVAKAFNVGRTGNILKRLGDIVAKKDITFEITHDDAAITSEITTFAGRIEDNKHIFEISPNGNTIKIDLTKKGLVVDIEDTELAMIKEVENLTFTSLPVLTHTNFSANDIDLIYKGIHREPVNASCTIVDNKPVIEPHKVGISVDKDVLAQHLSKGEKVFEIPITTVMPKITTDQFQLKMFADVLGEQTTSYDAGKTERTQNVTLASNGIDGTVIAPGKDFSFNKVVGERTYARGFKDATIFVGGKAEQGAGGGICQVSSTLYTAQLYADLQTVKRANHQFTVTYMPSGQDATVAYGVQDYVFRNNTAYPIKIVSKIGGGKLTIKILGTKTDKDLKITIVNNTVSTKPFEEKTVVSYEIPAGKTEVKQKGQNGVTVDTYKVYWRNGIEERRLFIHRSVYNPMERLIMVSASQQASSQQNQLTQPTNAPTVVPSVDAEAPAPTPTVTPKATPTPEILPTPSPIPTVAPTTVPTSITGI